MRDTTAKIEQYADITDDGIIFRIRAVAGGDIIEVTDYSLQIAQSRFDIALQDWRKKELSHDR